MITTTVILACCAQLGHAAEQKPDLSEPLAVAPKVEGDTPQYAPRVAWSASAKVWLVVWEDGHVSADETSRGGRAQDIFAARVSADGKVLDPKGIPVCIAKNFQGSPVVASDGKDFLVVWQDMRNGKDWDVSAARVSGEGKVLDADGFLVSGGEQNQCQPEVVFGGGSYYAVWLDQRDYPEYRVRGTRVSAGGQVLDAQGTEIIRAITDEEREGWRKVSFSPGKKGMGWHNYCRQPGALSIATNGKVHLVTTYAIQSQGHNGNRHLHRSVDAASGKPRGKTEIYPLETAAETSKLAYALGYHQVPLKHVAVGKKGFLSMSYFNHHGFGADGSGLRLATFFDPAGRPLLTELADFKGRKHKLPLVRLVVTEDEQHGQGYRTFSVQPNRVDLAWDGVRALHVADRYLQDRPKSKGYVGDYDVVGIFMDAEGKRISDLATGATVEPDVMQKSRPRWKLAAPAKTTQFLIATGAAVQNVPAVAAGQEGGFLVVWQEQPANENSRVMARVLRAK